MDRDMTAIPSNANPPTETVSGMVVSLAFWVCLLAAAMLFAAVGLSPRLVELSQLYDHYAVNQVKLVSLENQNDQLQRVIDAIRNDKDFAAELTRIEFDAVALDEEIIPVAPDLKLETRGIETPQTQPVVVPEWYRPWLTKISTDGVLRSCLLGIAAALIVVSFTWFQPASNHRASARRQPGPTLWQTLRSRYSPPV